MTENCLATHDRKSHRTLLDGAVHESTGWGNVAFIVLFEQ